MDEIYAGRPLPLIIAHRGAGMLAPENTLAAFRKALELGVDGIELDVMLCKSGEAVVIHDFTVDRTTDGHGQVKDLTLEELKRLDAGSWFDPRFAGERIPTLEEVFDLVGTKAIINVELKSTSIMGDGLEKGVVELIRRKGLFDNVIVSSFNPLALWRVRRMDPRIKTGLLYASDLPIYLRQAWFYPLAQPDALHPRYDMVTPVYLEKVKAKGHRVNVWTVNDPQEMRRLIDLGVDAIITDRPGLLKEMLGR